MSTTTAHTTSAVGRIGRIARLAVAAAVLVGGLGVSHIARPAPADAFVSIAMGLHRCEYNDWGSLHLTVARRWDWVRIDGGMADFGDCGHSWGVPEVGGKVIWIDDNPLLWRAGYTPPRVEVGGRVYVDPTIYQGACARVRFRYFDSSNGLIRSTFSSELCSGPSLWYRRSAVFTDVQMSNRITRVQVCTQVKTLIGTWADTNCTNSWR